MLKNTRLAIIFDMFLNPSFKMTTRSSNIARTAASIFIIIPTIQHGGIRRVFWQWQLISQTRITNET